MVFPTPSMMPSEVQSTPTSEVHLPLGPALQTGGDGGSPGAELITPCPKRLRPRIEKGRGGSTSSHAPGRAETVLESPSTTPVPKRATRGRGRRGMRRGQPTRGGGGRGGASNLRG
jgi:hypothetical protein